MFRSRLIRVVIIALLSTQGHALFAAESVVHVPSGREAIIPSPNLPFQDYVDQNSARIREVLARDYYALRDEPFGPGYEIDTALAMRAPYSWQPATGSRRMCRRAATHGLPAYPRTH